MDQHLRVRNELPCEFDLIMQQKLAPKHFNTRFIRVFVENVPWLVERLGIQVLPCVICFVKGVTKDRSALLAHHPNYYLIS
jgi:hypothetical protein